MVYKFFDKKFSGSAIEHKSVPNLRSSDLTQKLHKPIIIKLEKRKVCSSFKDDIWGADLADM